MRIFYARGFGISSALTLVLAAATGLAESTVKGYLKSARQKTRTTNRVELADWWERHSGVA